MQGPRSSSAKRDGARKVLREPLIHFLVGGLAIFAFYAWLGEEPDPASRTITLTQEDQARLALGFEQTMARPPTDAELDALVERWVRDEVLYREALRLGLDEGDPVLRRRLAVTSSTSANGSATKLAITARTAGAKREVRSRCRSRSKARRGPSSPTSSARRSPARSTRSRSGRRGRVL